MHRRSAGSAWRLDFWEVTPADTHVGRTGLRLAGPTGLLRGPDRYRALDLRRRRAQIRARRVLGLT
jgi:hypothetical protein